MNQNDDFMHYLVDDDESCEQPDCEFLSENDESESEASEDFVSDEEYERMQEQGWFLRKKLMCHCAF